MRQENDFPCTKCGACCIVADHNRLVEFFKKAAEHGILDKNRIDEITPLPMKSNGSCIYLQKDRTCGIYNDRPAVCRILSTPLRPKEMSTDEWTSATMVACNDLIDQRRDIPEEYKIRMSDTIRDLGKSVSKRYTQLMEGLQERLKNE